MSGSEPWIDPESKMPGCPACGGFGYHEDGTDEGRECDCCHGDGVATLADVDAWKLGQS